MADYQKQIASIDTKLRRLRHHFARYIFLKSMLRVLMVLLASGFLLVTLEGFIYFKQSVRSDIQLFYLLFGGIFVLIPCVYYFLIRSNRISAYNDEPLARRIARYYPRIRDRLLNGLQLKRQLHQDSVGYSRSLIIAALNSIAAQIVSYDFTKIIPRRELKRHFRQLLTTITVILIFVILFSGYYLSAGQRLWHAGRFYPVPKPFQITSLNGDLEVLGGDTVTVNFDCQGKRIPARMQVGLQYHDYQKKADLAVDSMGRAQLTLEGLRENVVYEGFVAEHSWFRPWGRISSGFDTIRVINRPEILEVVTRLEFPAYTGMESKVQKSNITEIYGLPGTHVTIRVQANKELKQGYLEFKEDQNCALQLNGNKAEGDFSIDHADQFQIRIADANQVYNDKPITYKIRISPDSYPMVSLLTPTQDMELNESMEIPIGIRISDDYGYTRTAIRYKLEKHYSQDQPASQTASFPLQNKTLTLQELFHTWDVSQLGLGPEDVISFQVEVYDNDVINGPKKGVTKSIRARFPSLNDLYQDFQEEQNNIYAEGEEIIRGMEQTKKKLKELSLKMLKDPQLKWEQKKQLQEQMDKTKQAGEKLSDMNRDLEQAIEKSQQNQLFTDETLQKYAKLQQTFQEIMSPELKEAMRKLQEALDEMNPEKTRKAMEEFKMNQEQFSKELDRMLELFERVKVEQAVDELAKRLTDLARRQDQVKEQLQGSDPEDKPVMSDLANQEKTIKRDAEIVRDIMERTAEDMQPFPLMPAEQLQQLRAEMEELGLVADLQEAQQNLSQGQKSKASSSVEEAARDLEQLQQMMDQYRQNFRQQNMQAITADFNRIISNTLQLSQIQEKMTRNIENTPRQSEQLMDVAVDQQSVHQNLSQLVEELIRLSKKTFGVTPKIGKQFGQASMAMQKAISDMEGRNPHQAARAGQQATQALNRGAFLMQAAQQQLQQSGSSSGFQNYLEQLQKMAGQQQGINQKTLELGMGKPRPTAGGKQAALQQLSARQQQVRNSLQQLQKEIENSATQQAGDLSGIAKDMDEVIEDLKNNKVLRKTIQRQERILTRMLDAQKSLRTQSYKKERKSRVAEEIEHQAPGSLPRDLGERRGILQKKLEEALQNGYTRDYQEIIRYYFEALAEEDIE